MAVSVFDRTGDPLPPEPAAPGAPDLLPVLEVPAPPLLPYHAQVPVPDPSPVGRMLRGH
jgi:hypothetical protein